MNESSALAGDRDGTDLPRYREDLAEKMADLLGPDAVRSGEAVAVLDPGWHPANFAAGLVVAPASTIEVSRLLAWCNKNRASVVPQGGRTGLVGGGVSRPGEIVLSLARMNRIEALDAAGMTAQVEAGVTLAMLQSAAAEVGLHPGIDTASRDSATIGGMIATNAGGIRAFRNGVMRHRLLGIEAVLADGTIVSDLTAVLKNNTGYDVKQLFAGSEGTLGVVTRAVMKLDPAPGPRATALLGLPDVGAGLIVVDHFRRAGDCELHAVEIMSGGFALGSARAHDIDPASLRLGSPVSVIVEVAAASEAAATTALETGLGDLAEKVDELDGVVATTMRQRDAIWLIREASEAMARPYGFSLWEDVSIPPARIDAWLSALRPRLADIDTGLELHFIGHLADGNLHVLVARPEAFTDPPVAAVEEALYRDLGSLGGSFSAEHGIGLDKVGAMSRFADPGKRAMMRRLKACLDPNSILNPGKVVPPE